MAASASDTRGPPSTLFLPDFCESRAVLAVVLIVELVALMFAICAPGAARQLLARSRRQLAVPAVDRSDLRRRAVPYAAVAAHAACVAARSLIAIALMLACIGVISEVVFQVGRFWSAGLPRHRHRLPDRSRRLPAAQPRRRIHRQRAGVALLLRERRMEAQRRDGGAGAHPCVAGAHPPALPLQQHEHHRRAHALVAGTRRAGSRGSRGSVPRQPERRQRAHLAERRDRDRAHARAHRAAAPARSAAACTGTSTTCRCAPRCRA